MCYEVLCAVFLEAGFLVLSQTFEVFRLWSYFATWSQTSKQQGVDGVG